MLYFGLQLLLLVTAFVAAHYDLTTKNPIYLAEGLNLLFSCCGAIHCYFLAKNRTNKPNKWYARWTMILLIVALPLLGALGFRAFLFEPFSVASQSMEPGLAIGDYFIVNKNAYTNDHQPMRGDVIVFKVHKGDQSVDYVKRVIGLPGETIQLSNGYVSINGKPLNTHSVQKEQNESDTVIIREILPEGKSVTTLRHTQDSPRATDTYQVPEGQYFVLGDNRDQSRDSSNDLGYIRRADIVGQAMSVLWNDRTYKLSYTPIE